MAVIEARGAFSEDINRPHVAGLLARPGIRDLGIEELGGQRVRHLQLPGAQGTADSSCDYDVDAVTFLPARLTCRQDGHSTGVTTYAVVPDTPANRAQLSLAAAHPDATVVQDPNGVTAGKAYLQLTTEDAMRRAQMLEVALNGDLEGCFRARSSAGEGRLRVHRGPPPDGRRARHRGSGLREPELRSVPRGPAGVPRARPSGTRRVCHLAADNRAVLRDE